MTLIVAHGGFNHVQSTPSSTWTITHSLNCKPIVEVFVVYNGALKKALPDDITYTDNMSCVITFTSPQSGEARLI